jgi:hypothetical protein
MIFRQELATLNKKLLNTILAADGSINLRAPRAMAISA